MLSPSQSRRLIEKLDEVCKANGSFDRLASIRSCENIAWIINFGLFGPANVEKALEYDEFSLKITETLKLR